MEKPIKIMVVEDNVLIADDMQMMLEDMGYEVVANVTSYEAAIEALSKFEIDLALLDIQLATDKTGIDIGQHIRKRFNIPFVFVTSNSDKDTINKAKGVKPNGYLVKPFAEKDLYSTIEITLSNFESTKSSQSSSVLKNSIFIKESQLYHKLLHNDIFYVKSDNVYVEVYTQKKMYLVRSTLKDFLSRLPQDMFYRTSKSYIINIKHIQSLNSKDIMVNDRQIPISKEYKADIQALLNL